MFLMNAGHLLSRRPAGGDRGRGRPRGASRRPRGQPLALEMLESRCMLSYTITDLGTLPGDTFSAAYGINNLGQVVGNSGDHAFLYEAGKMTDLGTLPGSPRSEATAINDAGQVVGWSGSIVSQAHAFLYEGGKMTDLGTLPGDTISKASGINAKGQVVGVSHANDGHSYHAFLYERDNAGGRMINLGDLPETCCVGSGATAINDAGQVVGNSSFHAFLYAGGEMTALGALPGDEFSIANGINATGHVVGYSYRITYLGTLHGQTSFAQVSHAFLYADGTMTDLGGPFSVAYGINAYDQVVGTSAVAGFPTLHAFLYADGTMTDLNNLLPPNAGWELTDARAINDAGQIVGAGVHDGQFHAFLLTPDRSPGGTPKAPAPPNKAAIAPTPVSASPVAPADRPLSRLPVAAVVATLVSASREQPTRILPESGTGFPAASVEVVPPSGIRNGMAPAPAAASLAETGSSAGHQGAVDLLFADTAPDWLASDPLGSGA